MLGNSSNFNPIPGGRFRPWRILKKLAKLTLYSAIIGVITISIFTYDTLSSDDSISGGLRKISSSLLKPIKFLAFSADRKLKGEDRDRVNILLLGIGGTGHDGAFLTDTIILSSYKPSTGQVAFLSIPRDLVVDLKPYGWRKINSANAFGEVTQAGKGPEFTGQAITRLTGEPIDYYARIDFRGFKKLIDQFGGINVLVENDLEDNLYPIPGKELVYPLEQRFEHLYIAKGEQHLDGETALKYARSRHATGIEGSDFARSRRQQKVITTFRDKAVSYKLIFQPGKIKALLESYQENINANIQIWEMVKLALIARDFDKAKIINRVLDNSASGPLVSTNFNGIFILEPKLKDYSEIKKISREIFDADSISARTGAGSKVNGLPRSDQPGITLVKPASAASNNPER